MPIFEYNNIKVHVPEDKIEAFKKNFPTATLFEEDEKEVEITPDVRPSSIEKPDEMMPDMDSLPGKPMGEASSVPRDDFAIDPFDTSDYVGPKMDTDLKSAFDKTSLGEARLSTIDKVANSPDYSIGVEQQAYNRLTGQSDRPMQMLGQTEDAIAKASRQEYENYKHQKEGTRIFKEGLIPKIKELEDRISVESEEAYQSEKAKLDKLQADKPFYLKALEGLAQGDPNKEVRDPFKGMEGVKTYNAASYFLNDANRIIKEAELSQADDQSGTNVGSAIRAFVDKGFSVETWNFGVNEFDRNGSILKAVEKSENGETLTKDENALLDALALNLAVNEYYGSDINRGYKWGEIAGESLPFMLEFMLNPIAAGTQGMARRVAIHAIKKMGAKGAGRTAIKVGTHVASDLVAGAAMAATTGIFKTAADGLNRMIGEPLYDIKEDGSIVYGGRVGGEDAVTAFMKAYGAQTIEYGSEMFGNNMMWNIMGKTKVAKGLRKQFKATGLGKVAGRMHASKAVKGLSKLETRAQWAGPIGELVEEWYGTILNATFIGDQEYKDVLDMDENLDMLAGFLITQGPMSAAKSFGYGIDRAQSNRDLKRFSSENSNHFDNWEGLKNQLADLPLLERIAIQKQMFARDDISIGAKESFGKYVAALTYNDALTGAAEGRKEVDLTAATANGQKLANEIQDKRSIVLGSLNNEIESYRAILGDRFGMSEQELADDPQLSTDAEMQGEMIEAARKHDIAYAEYESVLNGLVTQAEEFIKPQLESIAQATRKDGTVIKSSILGEDVFVMKGDIAFNADGSMDKKNSSEYLIVKNENGDKSQVPLRHLTYAEQMTAEEMTAEVKRQAKEKFVDPLIAKLEGVTKFELGEEVSFLNDKGETIVGRVGSKTQDGVVSISTNDGKILSFTEQDLASRQVTQSAGVFNVQDEVQIGIEGEPHDAKIVKIEDGKISLYVPNAPTAEGRYITVGEAELNSMLYNEAEVEASLEAEKERADREYEEEKKKLEEEEEPTTQTTRQIGDEVHTFEGDKTVKIEKRNSDGSLTQTWPAKETVKTKEEVKSEVQETVEETVQETKEETEDKFPRKKDGKVDFESIQEPATYKEALESEFGKEMAKEIVAEELEDAKKVYQAALKSKKGSAADRAYAKRDALARVKRFEEMMTPIKEQSSKEGTYEGDNINKPSQAIQDNWNDTQKEVGNDDTIRLQDGTVIEGTWVLVEADSLTPSHNSETLETNEGYPVTDNGENVNDRTYHDKRGELEHEARKGFDERAIQDPIVVQQGAVMSGNKRTLIGQMSARLGTYGGYLEVLPSKMKEKGIAEGAEKNYKNPMLVFERKGETPFTTEEMSRFNLQEKQAKSYTEIAIAQSKKKSEETLKGVRKIARVIDRYADMKSLYSSSEGGIELFNLMVEHGMLTRAEKNAIIDSEGKLTSNGQDFLESIVLGSVLEANTIQSLSLEGMKAHRNKITKSLTSLLKNQGQAFEVAPYIDAAVQYIHEARNKKSGVMGMFTFAGLFEDIPLHEKYDYAAATLAIVLEKKGDVFSKEMAHLADYFDPMSAKDAFHVGTKEGYLQSIIEYLPKDDKDAIETLRKGAESAREARDIADTKGEKVGQGEGAGVNEGKSDNKTGSDGSSDGGVSSTVEKSDPKFRATRRTVSYMAEIANLEKEFGVKATVHTSTETIGNTKARNQVEADIKADIPMRDRVKGWMVDGEVHIYLPHAESIADIYKTYIHEAIGHKGVREFLGAEKHDALMETIYGYLPTDFKDRSLAQLKEIHPEKTDIELKRLVADEFVAVLSEDAGLKVEHKNVWEKIVEAVMKALGKDKTFFQFGEAEKIALEVIGQAAQSMREGKQTEASKGYNVSFRKGALETQLSEAQKTQKEAQKRYNQAQKKHAKLSTQAAKDVLYGNKGQTDLFGAPPVGSDNLFQNEESINTGVRDILDDARREKDEAAREANRAAKAVEVIKEKIFNEQIGQQNLFDGEDIRFRMLGKQGAMRLDKLEDNTRRLDNLSVAKKMAADNIDAKKIKRATGWETAKDGKWRYEQLDLVLAKNLTPQEKLQMKDPVHLSDMIYDEHGLFDAYPILKETRVFQMAPRSWMDVFNLGMYDSENNVIFLNAGLSAINEREVLIHEVQHAIQNAEGFAQGGNLEIGKQEYIKSKYGSADAYQQRIEKIRQERDALDYNKASKAAEIADLETELDKLNKKLFVFNKQEKRAPITSEIDKLSAEIESQKDRILDLSVEIREIEREVILNEDAFYNLIAGEVEARNASKRMDMTAEERANSLLEETEDVPRKDQIVIMDGVEQSSDIRFRKGPEHLEAIEKVVERFENTIELKENETQKEAPNLSKLVLLNNVKDYGLYDKYEIVPVSDPLVNIYNLNRSIYGLGVQLKHVKDLHNSAYLDFDGDTGKLDASKVRKFSAKFNYFIRPYETALMIAKHSATEAAQKEIMDILKDIDHAKDYYERLAKDHNVLRTEESPRFRKTDTPEFKAWFGDSKVVDEKGEPLVVYHTSNQDFTVFDSEKLGTNTGAMSSKWGFAFTPDKIYSEGYHKDGNVVATYVSLNNPKILPFKEYAEATENEDSSNKFIDSVKKDGHDGIILQVPELPKGSPFVKRYPNKIYEVFAFEPTQIKSATDNLGTFDSENADIRFRKEFELSTKEFGEHIKKIHPEIKTLFLSENNDVISVDMIEVEKDNRKQGVGTAVMNDIVSYADANNKTLEALPGLQDDRKGTTSRGRLVNFYKRFGFVENKGRNKDFSRKSGAMYRTPSDIRFRKDQDFRDAHGAPAMDYETLREAIEESGDVNLSEIITGKQELVPDSYFDTTIVSTKSGKRGYIGAIQFGYNTKSGIESIEAINDLRDKIKKGAKPAKLKAKAYRAVPNSVEVNELIDRDWVTLSKDYADKHGLARFGKGEYKIIEQDVPINKLWWDGTDINEIGYDVEDNIRFRRDNAGFYSTVENALENVPQEKGTVNQFKAMLQKNGAKQGEMNWMDWDSFVEGKESITKAEVQEWINDNRIEIEAVENSSRLKVELMPGHENDWQVVNREGVVIIDNMAKQNAQEYADEKGKQRTRYSDYQEPGGENYREVLLTLPNKDPFAKLFTIEADSDGNYLLLNKEGKVIEETNIKNSQIAEEHFRKKHNAVKDEYGSPHFSERNIAVHVRMNDRVDSKGNKVLFVEEMQSDWAQEGKKKGFREGYEKEKLSKNDGYDITEQNTKLFHYIDYVEDGVIEQTFQIPKSKYKTYEDAVNYIVKEKSKGQSDIPNMPFKNTDQWVNLAIRKIMMEATEGGYDKVAWTTGEQQSERYSLSRQIDWIEYEQNENGKYQISLPIELIMPSELTEQDLADTFGKEMANKIIAGEGSDTSYGTKKIEGEDLEVGGDGMKGFYNKILPSQANKLGKQFGAKVEVIEIDGLGQQLALPVTEKMIDSTDEGMPLFRRGDNLMDNADNLKELIPNYNSFLNDAFNNSPNKEALISQMRSEGLDNMPKVIEQYLAEIDNPAELEAIKNELRVDMPDEAMRYLLWRNANPNDGSVAWRAKESMKMQELDPNVLFRRGLTPLPNAFNEYERRVRSRYNTGFRAQMFRIEEGWFDKMTSLRILQEAIAGKDIPGNQNAYQLENQLSSKNAAEIERYNKRVIEPMLQAVHKVFGNSLTDADLYLMAKHGLERNDKMAYYYAHEAFKGQKENLKAMLDSGEIGADGYNLGMQDINSQARELYEEYKENDYSGLTEVANQRGLGESFQEAGQNIVAEVEGRASQEDINELWARVNEANKIILKKQFDSGKMSQGEYEQIKGMYDFYVPLRGFDAKVATDYYSYLENKPSEFSSVLKKAWGRKSKADSPIATMMNMSESGFMEANRNVMKQAFLQLVQQNKSDLASVRDFWYVKDAEGNWTETFPEIPEGAMGQEVIDILDAFDARMEALGEDASRGRNNLDVGVKILPAQASEHAVRVWMGGKESIVYVNGNPRAAQAINGLIGKNHQEDGKTIMNGLRHLGRMMASNFTSNNPTFVVTNLLRDVQFAVAAGAIKEGGRYSANLALNLAKTPKTVAQNLWGQGNEANSEYQQYWDEFLMGGGETGYTQINTMDKHRKFVNSKLREFDNKVDVLSLFRGYVKQMETANRLIESNTRFATFVTSRQAGRDVQRSVADAKEITINFNRKGSGGVGASIAHGFYLFSNPAIQSARMMGLMAKNQPKAFFGALAATMSGGFLTPMMNELLLQLVGDDDDEEKYWNINPWVRRNNLVMYLPWTESKFMTIPLPHELRPFHGIGEMTYSKMNGRMRHENMAKEIIGQFSDMLPMDMAGEHDWFVPDFLKPIEQAFWSNKNFMNRPIYKKTPWNERDPEWTKAYKNTPEMLIDFSKWTNERSGGDDVKKGKADVKLNNPAVLNTLVQGYFGGALTMYTDIADLAYKLLTKEEVSVRDVPFVNKVVRESGSDVRNQNNYSEYSIYKEWYKDFKHDFDGYNKLRRDNPLYQNKYREMKAMPEYKTFKLMDRRIKAIDKLRDKNPERYEQKLEEFIKEMHMIEDGY